MPFPSGIGPRQHDGRHKTHPVVTCDTQITHCYALRTSRGDPHLKPPFEDGREQLMTPLTFRWVLRI